MNISRKDWKGYIFLLLAQLMVGVCIVSSKSLLKSTPVITILTIRFSIGFLFLLFIHFLSSKEKLSPLRSLSRFDWIFIVAQALCAGAFFNILVLFGLKNTTASVAGIITSALPAIVVIFSIIFLKERLTFYTALCVGFAVVGLVVINAHSLHFGDPGEIYGDVIILIALLPEAAYYILSKLHPNKLPVFLVSALMNGINIPLFLFFLLFQHQSISGHIFSEQALLLLIVGVGSALFYVFWFLGCNNVRGSSAGLTTAFMPIGTLFIAYIFLGEKISTLQFFGMVLVIFSILFNVIKQDIESKKHKLL